MDNGHFFSDLDMNNLIIRELQIHDVPEFWNLFSLVLSTEFPGYSKKVVNFFLKKLYTKTSFAYWLTKSIKIIFVAYIDDKLVGYAVIDEPYGGVSFCRWLGIKKEYQKKGIGTSLIANWILRAQETGCHKVEVAAQPKARKFYMKVGLKEEGIRHKSYFGIDQYVFGKIIGKPDDDNMISYG